MTLLAYILTFLATSALVESLLQKRRSSLKEQAMKLTTMLSVFLCLLLITQKPMFSFLLSIGFECLVYIVSNTKFKTLREHLAFSDFILYAQVFKFPRLYLPFLTLLSLILIPTSIIIIIGIFTIEPSLNLNIVTIVTGLGGIVIYHFLALKYYKKQKLSFNLNDDVEKYGLINALYIYTIKYLSDSEEDTNLTDHATPNAQDHLPNSEVVICLQSESFFDARTLDDNIRKDLLSGYDEFVKEAIYHGRLDVPAWGANTMRTEFSFLTGIKNEDLKLKKFYPHFFYAKQKMQTIASYYQSLGYKTVCIHPHPAGFFKRDKLFPNLGFDQFIDIEAFDKNETFGPYISDEAVGNKIIDVMRQEEKVFIFIITMENHGPLHLEDIHEDECNTFFTNSESHTNESKALAIYLRHLRNADRMLASLKADIISSKKNTTVYFFGDHLPSLPDTFEKYGLEDNRTDYFIWTSSSITPHRTNKLNTSVERLTQLTLKEETPSNKHLNA
jgi:phosphoglycerol transferase MdoB-like AlkP superfamily enzyme